MVSICSRYHNTRGHRVSAGPNRIFGCFWAFFCKLVCKRRFWVFVSSINKISYVFEAADYQTDASASSVLVNQNAQAEQ